MNEGSRASLVGTVLGRYLLERPLGEGGMGIVYAARHQDLGRHAALKILHERYDASEHVRLRFLREGQAASRIRHPNIVDVYDVGVDAGRAYLVMELLDGENLRSLLAREGPLSVERSADLLVPVIAALAAAHDLGVVHRDLKPDNIFLSTGRNTSQPKVLDFGISKLAEHETDISLTGTGAVLGTPYYMSPEQALAEKNLDSRADQYSVGVILYECLTGRRPIEETALYQQIQRIVHGDFSPPRQVDSKIPVAFEQLILKAMARSPADRFPSTRALGRELLVFASERIRANHAGELAHEEPPEARATAPRAHEVSPEPGLTAARGTDRVLALGTTLRESVHERESSRRPPRKRGSGLRLIAALAVFLGFAATLVWRTSKKPRPEPPATAAGSSSVFLGTRQARAIASPLPSERPPSSTSARPPQAAQLEGEAAQKSAPRISRRAQGMSPSSAAQRTPAPKSSTTQVAEVLTEKSPTPDPYNDQK